MTTYTFRRTRAGVTTFARVTLSRIEARASEWRGEWSEHASALRPIHGAVDVALRNAAEACRSSGGKPTALRIDEIVEVVSDTTPDAVACAAVMAAWREWNCDESDAAIDLDSEGRWGVRFDGSESGMTDVSIVFDARRVVRTSRGAVSAGIWLRVGDSSFPSDGWIDMGAAFLSALCHAELRLVTGASLHETVAFMEGPFELDLDVDEAGRTVITCIEHGLRGRETVRRCVTRATDFARSVAIASRCLLEVCESRGWTDRDSDQLRARVERLTEQLERS